MDGYPAGYSDPPWDGTEAGFREVVMPSRATALCAALSSALLPPGHMFTFGDAAPRRPADGQLWYDERDGTVRFWDAGAGEWTEPDPGAWHP